MPTLRRSPVVYIKDGKRRGKIESLTAYLCHQTFTRIERLLVTAAKMEPIKLAERQINGSSYSCCCRKKKEEEVVVSE